MKRTLRLLLNLLIAVIVPAAWIQMILGTGNGILSARGFASLRYFTILSNLLEGLASLVFLAAEWRHRRTHAHELLKYTAGVSVSLTFLTVMVFLGPLYGYASMFQGANFWFHLAIPLASAAELLFLEDVPFTAADNRTAVLPMICYGIFYLGNIVLHHPEGWPNPYDFYGFVQWGLPVGIGIYFLIVLITWGIGFVLRTGRRRALKA